MAVSYDGDDIFDDGYPEDNVCKCQKNKGVGAHTCPFMSDVHNNNEFLCNCCSECEQACMEDI